MTLFKAFIADMWSDPHGRIAILLGCFAMGLLIAPVILGG